MRDMIKESEEDVTDIDSESGHCLVVPMPGAKPWFIKRLSHYDGVLFLV